MASRSLGFLAEARSKFGHESSGAGGGPPEDAGSSRRASIVRIGSCCLRFLYQLKASRLEAAWALVSLSSWVSHISDCIAFLGDDTGPPKCRPPFSFPLTYSDV